MVGFQTLANLPHNPPSLVRYTVGYLCALVSATYGRTVRSAICIRPGLGHAWPSALAECVYQYTYHTFLWYRERY